MIAYEDGPAAMDWLARAFGFKESARVLGKDGRLAHGEMQAGDGRMMFATPGPDYHSPRRHESECAQASKWLQVPWVVDGVLVEVKDVDAHFVRAKAAGATILSELEGGFPGRRYRAADPEGHRWMFLQPEPALQSRKHAT